MQDEFYIGYEPEMAAGLASRIRPAALGLVILAGAVSATLVVAQGRFATATFEYGQVRVFEGRVIESPYPALLVSGATTVPMAYWLVGLGKHGASQMVNGRDGRLARVSGSLIERDGDRMIEVRSLDVIAEPDVRPLEPLRSLGSIALHGEIVDSKCHLGVMKPGDGPTHRDCAVRCLLGRITAMFVPGPTTQAPGLRPQASGAEGARSFGPSAHSGLSPEAWGLHATDRLALVDGDGRPFSAPLETLVGRPLAVRGEVLARGPLRFLATTPASIQVENGASFLNVASTHR